MKKLASLFAALVLMLALRPARRRPRPAASICTARPTPTPPASSRSWPPGTGITMSWGCGTF